MGMVRIRRFGIVRTATVAAVLYAVITLVVFLIIGVPLALLAAAAPGRIGPAFGAGVAGVLIVGLLAIVFYAAVGWVMTAIACALYNLVAGWVGGIEVEIEGLPPSGPGYGSPYSPGYQVTGYGSPSGGPGYGTPGAGVPGAGAPAPPGTYPPGQRGSGPPPPPR